MAQSKKQKKKIIEVRKTKTKLKIGDIIIAKPLNREGKILSFSPSGNSAQIDFRKHGFIASERIESLRKKRE